MRIAAHIFALSCGLASGLFFIVGVAEFINATTVFQQIVSTCFLVAAGAFLTSTGVWVAVDQSERIRRTLEEISDRGYDVVERLEAMEKSQVKLPRVMQRPAPPPA
jgi:hypothetical protein